jgi:DNA-binding CsgD family transcriptional regulator
METCAICGTERPWLHRHHLKPRSEGGTDADGIVRICANCHEDIHGGPCGGLARGRLANTPEARAKKADALRRRWGDAEYRERMLAKRRAEGQRRLQRPSKEELERLYLTEELSQDQIADRLGVSQNAVSRYLKHYATPSRGRGTGRPRGPWSPAEREQRMAARAKMAP